MNTSANLSVKYRAEVIRAGRSVEKREGRNLVVDGGLSLNTAVSPFSSNFWYVKYGTSTNPVKRGSAGITFTSTGSAGSVTVTASAGFFINSDVGRILKLATGEELRINAFTSGSVVVCSTDADSVTQAQTGAIHYVNDTALGAVAADLGTPNIYNIDGGTFDYATATLTFQRNCDSSAATSAKTVTEMCWTNSGNVMLGRVLLDAPIGIQVGDIIRLTLTIQLQYDTAAVVCGSGAFAGTSRLWGGSNKGIALNGPFNLRPRPIVGSPDISTIHNTEPPAGVGEAPAASYAGLSLGVWDVTITQSVNGANGTFGGFVCGPWVHKLDAPFTKTNTQTLAVTFRVRLTRTLVN